LLRRSFMRKIKSILLLMVGGILALFFYENWVTAPCIKIFGQELVRLNTSIIILTFFVLGFLLGILSHFSWIQQRRKKNSAVSGEQKAPESQKAGQQEEKKK
jgi:uncharacterized integral membrane protein